MRKLFFVKQNEIFIITIKGKDIWYQDKTKRIKLNDDMNAEEKMELDNAQNEDDVVKMCIADCHKEGLKFIKEEK